MNPSPPGEAERSERARSARGKGPDLRESVLREGETGQRQIFETPGTGEM